MTVDKCLEKKCLELALKLVKMSQRVIVEEGDPVVGASAIGVAGAHMVAASIATIPLVHQGPALAYLLSVISQVLDELHETEVDALVRRFKGENDG